MEKKRCQIRAGLPITCFEVPIIGNAELNLTYDEIYKCLCAKAEVTEILNDGRRIHLDFTNYNKNNYWELQVNNIAEDIAICYDGSPVGEITDMTYHGGPVESIPTIIDVVDEIELEESTIVDEPTVVITDTITVTDEEVIENTIVTELEDTPDSIFVTGMSIVEDEVKEEVPEAKTVTASTVSNYQVASRNSNNHKKSKNNNHKK